MRLFPLVILAMAATWGAAAAAPGTLPVVYDVDVVVAGGGCGAVAAALAARRQGARVFLFTSRDYLGEDVAGVMQLWLEPGESPRGDLGQALFADPAAVPDPGLPFTYAAALPAEDRHPDTDPPSRLRRVRAARDPQHDSVQYGGDVVITAELAAPTRVQALEIISFTRSGDFEVRDVDVAVRLDGEEWEGIGRGLPRTLGGRATFRIPIGREIRQVRMSFRRAGRATRILLGSIAFLPEDPSRPAAEGMHVRPLHAKATLEGALLEAEIPFLFGCYAAEPLLDEAGGLGGLVMANRMGRQAVRAKVVVDATETAVVARSAGVAFEAPDTGGDPVRWVSIGSEPLSGEGVRCRALPFPVLVHDLTARKVTERPAHWYETTLTAEPPPDTWPERARWEQDLLDRICAPSQLLVADRPCAVSVRRIRGRSPGRGATAADVTLEACRPLGTDRLWVLGGCMDVPREEIGRLLRPVSILVLGGRVGAAAAAEAAGVALRGGVRVGGRSPAGPVYEGEVRELRDGLRPSQRHGVAQASPGPLPLLGTYDVVVVGGGTSGAAAGIAAARQGARTLVLEHLYGLGGVGTLGMIGKYWYGNRVGFAATVPENPLEVRLEFYRRELRKAGGEVWFGVLGCGAAVEGNRVTGVVVATPYGRGVVRAAVVIDGTGNADIAAVAGAETRFVEDFLALQQSHIPPREVGASYINGNRSPIDASDPVDVTAAMVGFRDGAFDRGQLVGSRERRRIVGDICLDWLDQVNRRTFPDSIALARSDYDSHGYQVHPYFMLQPARVPGDHRRQFSSFVPYRCLLPAGLEGILVVGLGLSAHRDAMPIVRMQPDLQNIGYAAGVAAAMAAGGDLPLRQIDGKALQAHLIRTGALAEDVLGHTDSGTASDEALVAAVASVGRGNEGIGIVLANPARAVPLLRAAFDSRGGAERLACAQALGVMGDAYGVGALVAEVRRRLAQGDLAAAKGTDGMDPLVPLLWALGGSGDGAAVGVLCEFAGGSGCSTQERLRAVAVSLGRLGDPRAAPVLGALARSRCDADTAEAAILACALFRCGDPEGTARRVLHRLADGSNGPLARLASQVLAAPAAP